MPYVKKEEYEKLKAKAIESGQLGRENITLRMKNELLQQTIESYKSNKEILYKMCEDMEWEIERWERYYQAAIKTFKITEYVEMPGCFNPMESIEYIAKRQSGQQAEQQEETKDEVNRHGC